MIIAELTFAASLVCVLGAYMHQQRGNVQMQPQSSTALALDDISVEVLAEWRVGEVLMYPFGPYVCFHDCYAVLVLENLDSGFYRACTFHDCPKILVLHTSQLYTKMDIERRSQLYNVRALGSSCSAPHHGGPYLQAR